MVSTSSLAESPAVLVPAANLSHSTRSVRRGEVLRLNRGVYVYRSEWIALSASQRYLARVHAHVLWHPDDILCLESAAVLHGLPVVGAARDVHILSRHSATSRGSAGVRVHVSRHDDRIIDALGGARVVSVCDTAIDIARLRHPGVGLAVADAALRVTGPVRPIDLIAMNEDRASARGRRHARWALNRADAGAESPLESLSRAVVEWCGFVEPELQVPFVGSAATVDRVDMWWPEQHVAGEADGYSKYDGRYGDPVAALQARNERDRRLRDAGARTVAHWTWGDVVEPAHLQRILRGVGVPVVGTPNPERLASLEALLRPAPTRETASR